MKKKIEDMEEKKPLSPSSIRNEDLPDPNTWAPFPTSNWKKDYRRVLGDLSHHRTKYISYQALQSALSYTGSFRAAAKYLNVSVDLVRKYARFHIDSETGKSLYELYRNSGKPGRPKHFGTAPRNGKKPEVTKYLQDVIEGREIGRASCRERV